MSQPRIRSIKPELWGDEDVGRISRDERLLMIGLITMADDEGRLLALPSRILGHVYPWDADAVKHLERWLAALERVRIILRYLHDEIPYIAFRHWKRHQKINRPKPSVLPAPPDHVVVTDNAVIVSGSDHGDCRVTVTDDAVNDHDSLIGGASLPRVPIRSDPEGKKTVGAKTGAARANSVSQDEPPSMLPEGLLAATQTSLTVLERIHGERGGNMPTLRGVGLAVARFPDRDHASVAAELEHWALAGHGQSRPVKDWARTFATFLERSASATPIRASRIPAGASRVRQHEALMERD